jgi:membrane protease YdiL (CAAX protease family)
MAKIKSVNPGVISLVGILLSQGIIAVLILLYNKYMSFSHIFTDPLTKYGSSIFQVLLFDFLGFGIPLLVILGLYSIKVKRWTLDKSPDLKGSIIGIILGIGFIAVTSGNITSFITNKGLYLLAYSALLGLSEEIFFRGFLQSELELWIGKILGSILQIVVFCISHITTLLLIEHLTLLQTGMRMLAIYLPLGVLLTLLRLSTKRPWGSAIAHTLIIWGTRV